MKVGLCTPYKIDNYGTKLQAYAVQEKIKGMGYDVEVVNFDRRSDYRISKLIKRYANKEFIQGKIYRKNDDRMSHEDVRVNLKIRKDAINSFDQSHYKLTPLIKGYPALCEYAKECTAIICGSDQIWLPGNVNNPTVTLEFTLKSCKRIAFAPSFGISVIPDKLKKTYKNFLTQFDSLSVREIQGAKMIKDLTGIDAPVVLDPTLTLDENKWNELAEEGRNHVSDKYMFCYLLGTTEQHRIEARRIADNLGLKLVIMPHFKAYVPADEKYSDVCLYDVSPCDFVRMIREADYVCTDSFHATVFSIINKKRFMTFERFKADSVNSANSRIYSLLGQLDLLEHIWSENTTKAQEEEFPDYAEVNKKLSLLREQTDAYLISALKDVPKAEKNLPVFHEKVAKDCCGCGACEAICPKDCITMINEEGTGFRYPKVTKGDNCIHCNQCNVVCPYEQHHNVCHVTGEAYYAVNNVPEILNKSSSGGIFFPLTQKTIRDGGYVCGATYDENFDVKHIIVHKEEDLVPLIGSKYAESDLGKCFYEIRDLLEKEKKVLFSGTPCQVHGLKSFLKKEYDNLFVVDLLCYGIQAPEAWKRYKDYITPANEKILNVNMRDKNSTWQNYSMSISFSDGTVYCADKNTDLYAKTYSKGFYIRPSCFNCQLKAFPRRSDITIGDFWDIDKIMPEKNDGRGSSIIFPQTEKGLDALKLLGKENVIQYSKIDEMTLRKVHPLFCLSGKRNRKSGKFMTMLKDKNNSFDVIVKACQQSAAEKILRSLYRKVRNR